MRTFREREKRLQALEAQAERTQAAELDDDMPPYWSQCMVCGNVSDPRQQDPADPRCQWCGGTYATDRYGPGGWVHTPANVICPRCDDAHAPAARQASEWNRAGACPACQYAPPPTDSQPIERFEAWMVAMDLDDERGVTQP